MLSGRHSIQIPVLEKCGQGWGWLCLEIKASAQSLTLASLTTDPVTADGTRVRSRGATQDNRAGWESQTSHSCSKAAAGLNLLISRDGEGSGDRRRMKGKEGCRVSLADASCIESEPIWNEVVGFVSKEYLHWDSSILPLLLYYERMECRVTQSWQQPTYLNVNDDNYWPGENLLVQVKYFTNIIGRICVGLAVLLPIKGPFHSKKRINTLQADCGFGSTRQSKHGCRREKKGGPVKVRV